MAKPQPKVAAVSPPKIIRGKRGTQVPKEVLDTFIEVMATVDENNHPSWVSDQIAYSTRAKANAAAMKIRKALADDEIPSKYKDVKEIQSRVWSTGELNDSNEETEPFYFALAERPAE
jgi:hypothetical protein